MFFLELPSGAQVDFDSAEALERAVRSITAGTPVVVRSEKDGSREVLWAPGDDD